MNTSTASTLRLLSLATVCLALGATVTPALARERSREAAGPKRSAERQVQRNRGDVDRSTTWTNRQGQTGSHEFHRDVDRENKTVTVDAATTRPNGDTASRHLVTQKTDTGTQTSGEIQRFNGNTVTVDATKTRTETGVTRQATLTNEQGKSATLDSVRTRTDDGFTRETVASGPNGKTATTEVDVSRTDESVTRTVTRTGPNGGTSTTTQSHTKTVTPAPGS